MDAMRVVLIKDYIVNNSVFVSLTKYMIRCSFFYVFVILDIKFEASKHFIQILL